MGSQLIHWLKKMIKEYDLREKGMEFKSDFNLNFDQCLHIFQLTTNKSYLKIDIVQHKKTKTAYLVKREADFVENKASLEVMEF
jgi:hypothetical protein